MLPSRDTDALRAIAASRDAWRRLETDMLSLSRPELYPGSDLSPSAREAAERAVRDLLDPIQGLEAVFGTPPVPERDVAALVGVELLPDSTIRRLHGSDAFTDAAYDLDSYLISRAVIRLPDGLAHGPPDDLANFLAHEMGHALGMEGHLAEMWSEPNDATWFWDRLMTVPLRPGQPWQPATSEDIFAIAAGRYRLREGWIKGRLPRFAEAPPYRRLR